MNDLQNLKILANHTRIECPADSEFIKAIIADIESAVDNAKQEISAILDGKESGVK